MATTGRINFLGLGLVALAALAAATNATAADPHPRILLDGPTTTRLVADATANTDQWVTLKAQCDRYTGGTANYPDEIKYPDSPDIGEGYQGDGYLHIVLEQGLCFRVASELGVPAAADYAATGVDILQKMSAPVNDSHYQDPLRDAGYGIRNYGVALAVGYDWLYPALSAGDRDRIGTALGNWITQFETGGFERSHPSGNYFAGYYAAKAYAALAFEGDTMQGDSWLEDWQTRVQGAMVQPFFAQNLNGGGWPEGWNYGALASLHMSLPSLAVLQAKGVNLTTAQPTFEFPINQAKFLTYFSWPGFGSLEDAGAVFEGDNPTPTRRYLYRSLASTSAALGSSFAPYFHALARAVESAPDSATDVLDPALDFLLWQPSAPESDYHELPLSYYAQGIEKFAARSSWQSDAIWAAFSGGPYTNYPGSGEQYFDQGSIAIRAGSKPVIVNAIGALMRNTPGTNDSQGYGDAIYNQNFSGDSPARSIYNVYYVEPDQGKSAGQSARMRDDDSQTSITEFHDSGTTVTARASKLEDQYGFGVNPSRVASWTRDVTYIRPGLFVLYDRTATTAPDRDQWLAFHVRGEPQQKPRSSMGVTRADLIGPDGFSGTVQGVLPVGHTQRIENVFDSDKVFRIEQHATGATNRWLTVITAGGVATDAPVVTPLTPSGGVLEGDVRGALISSANLDTAVLSGAAAAGNNVAGSVRYEVGGAKTHHVLRDLAPMAGYTVSTAVKARKQVVAVIPGGDLETDAAGTLEFETDAVDLGPLPGEEPGSPDPEPPGPGTPRPQPTTRTPNPPVSCTVKALGGPTRTRVGHKQRLVVAVNAPKCTQRGLARLLRFNLNGRRLKATSVRGAPTRFQLSLARSGTLSVGYKELSHRVRVTSKRTGSPAALKLTLR